MTNKIKISMGIVAGFLLLGSGGALAYNQACTTPEAKALRNLAQYGNSNDPAVKAKLAGLPIVEREEARICALQKLTPEETARIIAQKNAMTGPAVTPAENEAPPPPTLGIQNPISQDILGKNLVLGTNSWWGYVNGTLTTVTGTAYLDKPSQGVLFVWVLATTTASGIGSTQAYPAPTATGPLKIVSESNGVITAVSLAGTYEAYDMNTNTRRDVTTTGSTTYTFDLTSRSFK